MSTCSVAGCGRKVIAKGLCGGHYKRLSYGTPLNTPLRRRISGATCTVSGCDRRHIAHGFCHMHLSRHRNGTPMDQPVRTVLAAEVPLAERLRTYAPEGAPDECWEWTRALNKGYGMISVGGGRLRGAHIVAWELASGQALPEGQVIRHSCDNPPCTNPAHLVLGTHADNVADRVEHGKPNKGVDHPHAKLTDDDVTQIRELYSSGVYQTVIAKQFGVSQANISFIVNGQAWGHIS